MWYTMVRLISGYGGAEPDQMSTWPALYGPFNTEMDALAFIETFKTKVANPLAYEYCINLLNP